MSVEIFRSLIRKAMWKNFELTKIYESLPETIAGERARARARDLIWSIGLMGSALNAGRAGRL